MTIAELIDKAQKAIGNEVSFVGLYSHGPYYEYIAAIDPTMFIHLAESHERMRRALLPFSKVMPVTTQTRPDGSPCICDYCVAAAALREAPE